MKLQLVFGATLLLLAAGARCEILPQPGDSSPRIQSVQWQAGETVLLTMLPRSALTVMFEPGERIRQVAVNDNSAWHVEVSTEEDSVQIVPAAATGMQGSLEVATDRRDYRFGLRVDEGLTAAYLVQFRFAGFSPISAVPASPPATSPAVSTEWRLSGDREVRPLSVTDDGAKTIIAYLPDQALPAVMAIGPTGEEEVVNGYMRGEVFVIDRVHQELVFRIDKKRATARRTEPRK